MIPLYKSHLYQVSTMYSEKSVIIEIDNEKRRMKHKKILVEFKHNRTGDKLVFSQSGRGLWEEDNKRITEDQAREEFKRLLDDKWEITFQQVYFRLIMGI